MPQTNGQAESTNKIVKAIKKSLDTAKGAWVDDLLGVLWSTRTTAKEATGRFPFRMVYGREVLLPEVGIPSPRMIFYEFKKNEEEKAMNLDLLPQTRGNALLKSIRYKQRITQQFSRRVKVRPIQLDDWVVRKLEATGLLHLKGKLGANWDNPYKVT